MNIRNATQNDFEEMFQLWNKAELTIGSPQKERLAYKLMLEKNPEFFLVAEDNGIIIGTILGSFNGRTAWINHVAVDPEYQGKGLGSMLMAEVEKRFRKYGVSTIRLGVYKQDLIPFYEKFGYAVIKDIIFMGKKLV